MYFIDLNEVFFMKNIDIPDWRPFLIFLFAFLVFGKVDQKLIVSTPEKYRCFLLLDAINQANFKDLQFLVQSGVAINCNTGTTPLINAAEHGNIQMVTYLLDHGANPDDTNSKGNTALEEIIGYRGSSPVLHALCFAMIHKGTLFPLMRKNRTIHNNILRCACREPDYSLINLLIDSGAVFTIPSNGRSVLADIFVDQNSDDKSVALLNFIKRKKMALRGDSIPIFTPLMAACSLSLLKTVKWLVDNDAEINAMNGEGKTALFFAVDRMNPDVVRLLLKSNAKVCQPQALWPSCTYYLGAAPINSMLLKATGDINARGRNGTTLLMNAVDGPDSNFVKSIIEAGADVNLQDDSGHTVLYYYLKGLFPSLEKVDYLLSRMDRSKIPIADYAKLKKLRKWEIDSLAVKYDLKNLDKAVDGVENEITGLKQGRILGILAGGIAGVYFLFRFVHPIAGVIAIFGVCFYILKIFQN
jgi:ankyrin repeat protein